MRKLILLVLSLVALSGFAQTILTARFGVLQSNMSVVTNVSDVASLDYVNAKTDELEAAITVITNEMTVVTNKLAQLLELHNLASQTNAVSHESVFNIEAIIDAVTNKQSRSMCSPKANQ